MKKLLLAMAFCVGAFAAASDEKPGEVELVPEENVEISQNTGENREAPNISDDGAVVTEYVMKDSNMTETVEAVEANATAE